MPKSIYEIYDQGRFRIPLIFFGEVIKAEFRGKVIGKVGGLLTVDQDSLTKWKCVGPVLGDEQR